jgi:hypothetical protein
MKFISEISLFFIIPILLISALAVWFFYIKNGKLKELSKTNQYLIYLSRFFALFFIGTLLLGLLFEFVQTKSEKPILITLIDNSASLKNYKDSAQVLEQIKKVKSKLNTEFNEKYEKVYYTLGSSFKQGDDINLKDSKSNISQAFESIFSNYYNRNIGGIILVSDGNFNEGQNPIYAASKIPFTPIYTLGVGDTISKKDQVIRDVISNEIAFLKNKFPVEVDIEALKVGKRSVTVSISKNGKTIASQSVNYTDGQFDSKQVIFELEANEVGFQHYVAEVKAIENEYTLKNNLRSFYVEVLDARNKILLLSGAPHPDLSALKSVLEQDENVQIEIKSIEKWDKNTKNIDLIVWHEPGVSFSDNLNQSILNSKIPVLYFIGPNTNSSTLQKLDVGLSLANSNQTKEVQANISEGFELFELSSELKNELQKYPPVFVKYGNQTLSPKNKVFLNQKLGNINKKESLMFFGASDNRKYGVFLGEGIWRWKMANYLKFKNNDLFNEFFQKTNQFLVQKENTSNLRVSLPKRFTISEDVLIKAEFYNEAMELITKPKINFSLLDQNGKKSSLEFGVSGNYYLLPLGKLKAGTYKWIASTNFAGKKYNKSGNFVVENIEIEKLDTKANHELLRQISNNSQGKFQLLKNSNTLLDAIKANDEITSTSYQESSFDSLLDFVLFLLLILTFLSLEWFIKRWNGFY